MSARICRRAAGAQNVRLYSGETPLRSIFIERPARVAESPGTAPSVLPIRNPGARYDADELFPDSPRLSERERETLELVTDGKTNGVIATVMRNSKRTVQNHITKSPAEARRRRSQRGRGPLPLGR